MSALSIPDLKFSDEGELPPADYEAQRLTGDAADSSGGAVPRAAFELEAADVKPRGAL